VIEAISKLVRGESLTEDEAATAMKTIMSGEATSAQIAGLIVGLRVKGETVEEITGMARAVRSVARPIQVTDEVVDVVGTGGDGLRTFNISTLAAIVTAACGVRVAKHGNRAASSLSGSADVLEALGVKIDLPPEGVARCVDEVGIGFMFAPIFHPSFRHASAPRRELAVPTVFNILGPLCNPARARYQAMGVAQERLAPKMAEILGRLGVKRTLVFHGTDGMDELTLTGPSLVVEVMDGQQSDYQLDPRDLGLQLATAGVMRGGAPADNAAIAREILGGTRGPRRDVVLLNAAAALRARGAASDWRRGLEMAAEAIDSGKAEALLKRWAVFSQSAA
jgi:anthranilate phosphoribosyltransferase